MTTSAAESGHRQSVQTATTSNDPPRGSPNSATRIAAGFDEAHEFHFHDLKAKAVSDSPDELDAMNRGGRMDMRTTWRLYRRKPTEFFPLPRVPKKAG